jgi:hypothetical protein
MSAAAVTKKPVIGIFAIQGAVEEHANLVRKCGGDVKEVETVSGGLTPGKKFILHENIVCRAS